jgi:hypothetical protein
MPWDCEYVMIGSPVTAEKPIADDPAANAVAPATNVTQHASNARDKTSLSISLPACSVSSQRHARLTVIAYFSIRGAQRMRNRKNKAGKAAAATPIRVRGSVSP